MTILEIKHKQGISQADLTFSHLADDLAKLSFFLTESLSLLPSNSVFLSKQLEGAVKR